MSTTPREAEALLHPHTLEEARDAASFVFLNNAFDRLVDAAEILGDRIVSEANFFLGIQLTREETALLLATLDPYKPMMKDREDYERAVQNFQTQSYHEGNIFRLYEPEKHTWRIGIFVGSKSGGLLAARITKSAERSTFSIDSGDSSGLFFEEPTDRFRESGFVSAFRTIANARNADARELSNSIPESG